MAVAGDLFELIDGDTLRIHHKEIKELIFSEKLWRNEYSVISILGAQSSGKSTLLNNCLQCKFATSSAKCTHGVNIAIRALSDDFKRLGHPNHAQIIVDTEGLFSSER